MELEQLIKTLIREITQQFYCHTPQKKILILTRKDFPIKELPAELNDNTELWYLDDPWHQEHIQRWIMPCLSCSQLADLSQGKAGDEAGNVILSLILKGLTVEVLDFEYKQYTDTAPQTLLRLYAAQEKIIAGFGIKAFEAKNSNINRYRQQLMTEKELQSLSLKGVSVIELPHDCLVTPLAKEFARDHHITLKRI